MICSEAIKNSSAGSPERLRDAMQKVAGSSPVSRSRKSLAAVGCQAFFLVICSEAIKNSSAGSPERLRDAMQVCPDVIGKVVPNTIGKSRFSLKKKPHAIGMGLFYFVPSNTINCNTKPILIHVC